MDLVLHNTLSGRKEKIVQRNSGKFSIFVCGPTVQGQMHLGHARTYLVYDVIARIMRKLGNEVIFVMNITDIDEKIAEEAKKRGVTPEEHASIYSKMFLEDMRSIGINTVTRYESVSSYISKIIKYISLLEKKGFTYRKEGYVMFDTSKQNMYGALSHLSKERIKLMPVELYPWKKNINDFSLWRPVKLASNFFDSPWGRGSPGWHIQDTTIALELFPEGYDVHGGAYELIYPHHESSMTITKAITGREDYVSYWVHTHLVKLAGKKMSKTEGNIVSVREMLKKYGSSGLRFALLSKSYRQDIEINKIKGSIRKYSELRKKVRIKERGEISSKMLKIVMNDLNTEAAINYFEQNLENRDELPGMLAFMSEILGIEF